jgi:hypothetical protein
MVGISPYLGNAFLNWMRGVQMPSPPASMFVGLFNGDPDAGGTEVTTQVLASGRPTGTFSASTAKSISNTTVIDFGNSAGAVTITHMAVFDAKTGGNIFQSKALSAQRQIAQGDPVKYPIGNLSFSFP